jgi:hypothetical protein
MARYRMTVLFDAHEELEMKYVARVEDKDRYEIVPLQDEALKVIKSPHINKLYEDVLERMETSLRHPVTYDIVSFEKLKEE